MDRKTLVNILRKGWVECPPGKSRLWLVRCFEITAEPGQPVEVDEYEAYHEGEGQENGLHAGMIHVGRSRICEDGSVAESAGTGRTVLSNELTASGPPGKV